MSGEETGASALEQLCLLAKSMKGNSCAALISQALDHPAVFVFGELLDMKNVQELAGTPSEPSLELLKLFAYGTWSEYQGRASTLPELSDAQQKKLKKLSLVTLCANSKSIPYDKLMRELEVSSLRQLEDLLIECFYEGLLQGKLDQQAGQLDVHYCIGRDIHPSDIESMCETLGQWHHNSVQMLASMSEKLENYKEQCDAQRLQALELEQKIEQGKAHAPDAVDFANASTEYDVLFDDDVEKIRKGGRTKGKHALGVGLRK